MATFAGSTAFQLLREYRINEKADISEVSGKDIAHTFLTFTGGAAATRRVGPSSSKRTGTLRASGDKRQHQDGLTTATSSNY